MYCLKPKSRLKGVSAIEFAVIFPVLFLMLYALLTYSIVFAVKHSLSLAAAEGARAAVRFNSVSSDTVQLRREAACLMALNSLTWLTAIKGQASCNDGSAGSSNNVISVTVIGRPNACAPTAAPPLNNTVSCIEVYARYSYAVSPIIPVLQAILPVPQLLEGKSVTQIALRN